MARITVVFAVALGVLAYQCVMSIGNVSASELDPGREPRCSQYGPGSKCVSFVTPPAGYVWESDDPHNLSTKRKDPDPSASTADPYESSAEPHPAAEGQNYFDRFDQKAQPPAPSVPDPGGDYLSDTVNMAAECQAHGGEPMKCYVESSPTRCKAAAVNFVSDPDANRRTWALCVRSCAGASVLGRTFGDCHR